MTKLISTTGLVTALQGSMAGVNLSSSSSYSYSPTAPLAPSPSSSTTTANTTIGDLHVHWGVVDSGWSSRLGLEHGDRTFPLSHAFMIKLMVAQAGATEALAAGTLKDQIIEKLHSERASVKQTPKATPIPSPAVKQPAVHFSSSRRGGSSLTLRSPSALERARPPVYPASSSNSSSFSLEPDQNVLPPEAEGLLEVGSGGWEPWERDTAVVNLKVLGLVDDEPLDEQLPGGERRGASARRGGRAARSLRLSGAGMD